MRFTNYQKAAARGLIRSTIKTKKWTGAVVPYTIHSSLGKKWQEHNIIFDSSLRDKGQEKKKQNVSLPDFFKKESGGPFFVCFIIADWMLLYKLLPFPRTKLKFFGQILINDISDLIKHKFGLFWYMF